MAVRANDVALRYFVEECCSRESTDKLRNREHLVAVSVVKVHDPVWICLSTVGAGPILQLAHQFNLHFLVSPSFVDVILLVVLVMTFQVAAMASLTRVVEPIFLGAIYGEVTLGLRLFAGSADLHESHTSSEV
jgi:hypothetical protein